MHWIDRAEAKFGHLAIPGLLRYVALANAFVFIAYKLYPPTFQILDLDPNLVLRGEVWRLFTYIFIPGIYNLIPLPDWFNAAVFVLFMWWIGDGLDRAWGPFKTNLFYLLGMIGTTIAAFIASADPSGFLLNTSLLFAFARFYPEVTIYIFFVLPVKVKWMAWISAAFVVLGFLGGPWAYRAAVLAALGNFFVFFGRDIVQDARHRQEATGRRRRFEKTAASEDEPLHRCAVCGRTEIAAPDLDFRVARDGQEYCSEHLPKAAPPPAQT